MQLTVSGHHIDLTEAMQSYVENKMERLERHFDQVTNINVILSVEKMRQKAEATIHIRGNDLFANAEDENMYAAIDALVDKLDRQIKKHKEKLTDHHRAEGIESKQRID
ncbi:MAG: ribosome-associated translation inhibitor RaiA [Gammaproteobacteria bacterium]|nr:ribosome-associated translation inhibitor RaiA [Gammaproteobacteria bacterium]